MKGDLWIDHLKTHIHIAKFLTSIPDMQADEVDPCGTDSSAEPNFPTFSLETVQQFPSTAEREDSERYNGLRPKCFSYSSAGASSNRSASHPSLFNNLF